MAEYIEVMKQKKRMCNSTLCCKCDIFHLSGEDISNCSQFILNNPSKAETIIMTWAAEHPEPVYPTYWTWLINSGVINGCTNKGAIERLQMTPIPADMAQKLGIEPKEGVC